MSIRRRHEDAAITQARALFDQGDVHEALAVLESERDALVAHADTHRLDRLADEVDELAGRLRGDDYRWFKVLLDSIETELARQRGEPAEEEAAPPVNDFLGVLSKKGDRQTGRQASAWCPTCQAQRLGVRQPASHGLHLALSIITGGLWLPVWFVLANKATTQTFHCTVCGTAITTTEDFVGTSP